MLFDSASGQLSGIFDFGEAALITPHDEFGQLFLDWPARMVPQIAKEYEERTRRFIDMNVVKERALFCRASFYATFLKGEMPSNITDCREKLEEMIEKVGKLKSCTLPNYTP